MSLVHTVRPGEKVRLSRHDPRDTHGYDRERAERRMRKLSEEMADLHDLLFYAAQHGLLIVLQGLDTAGKDGTIRHILEHVNVQSAAVIPFKVPTPLELAHDFLWRVHDRAPRRGSIAIFNRSHYEDVLVVRVHGLVPEKRWRGRYDDIVAFERLLAREADTIVLKFYLHISKAEQKERLLDREKEDEKAWKLSVGDWQERERWPDYTRAYEEALSRTSQPHAPWMIVNADHKWFRNLAVSEALVQALRPYRKRWLEHLEAIGETARRELRTYRREK